MTDFGSGIKDLYEKFVLRDLLSFVTPGAMIVLAAFVTLMPYTIMEPALDKLFDYSRSIHWALYIPLFGLFFLVGFAT